MGKDFFRGRRLRQTPQLRSLVRETSPLQASQLIMPYFVCDSEDENFSREIPAMPGQFQHSINSLMEKIARARDNGLQSILLFGIPKFKDSKATSAWEEDGIIQRTVRAIKDKYPDLLVITDVCLCEYMDHGHCGILRADGVVENDSTLPVLAKTALSHVQAGADIVAPSDMMDGRIAAIRNILDDNGYYNTPVMSYAVKYASALYGPFRDAAESAPACGDRKSYQMDPANSREAVLEAYADLDEGADALIIKPGGPYSDIISRIREKVNVPLAAYQVSGEYSMIKAAGQNNWINEEAVILESLTGLKRAGADMLITYFTDELLDKKLIR